ncbi:MAG: RHS repeat-associated core domain-containing protein, partial [Flavobacteriaceae bacterium]
LNPVLNDGDDTDFGNMDVLDYAYHNSEVSNKLYKVRDDGEDAYGFKDGSGDTQDYWYDDNGNMTRDLNKGIGTTSLNGITYNHLNLPTEVKFDNDDQKKITYIYDATGVKLQKIVSTGTTTDYAGNYVYEGGSLQFFNHPEGYIEPNGSVYDYIYQYKDHLGNIRISYKDVSATSTPSLEIQEENNYYPFGLKHKGYNYVQAAGRDHKFEYNGIEIEESLDYSMMETTFRHYDAAIGRFVTIDPLGEVREYLTPYNYVQNSPLTRVDPMGLSDYGVDNNGNIILLKKSDGPDKIYSITRGDNNEISINDTNGDKKIDKSDSSGDIDDKSLLVSLSISHQKDSKKFRSGFTDNQRDAYRLFTFLADNTGVEWGINHFRNKSSGTEGFFIGTYHDPELSPTPQSIFEGFDKFAEELSNVHSHPGINFDDEDWGDGVIKLKNGNLVPGTAGDYVNVRNGRSKNSNFYVYFPEWKTIYQYTTEQARIKIMTVRDKDQMQTLSDRINKSKE